MVDTLALQFSKEFLLLGAGVFIAGGLLGKYLIRRFPPDEHALARQAEMKARLADNKRRKQLKQE